MLVSIELIPARHSESACRIRWDSGGKLLGGVGPVVSALSIHGGPVDIIKVIFEPASTSSSALGNWLVVNYRPKATAYN